MRPAPRSVKRRQRNGRLVAWRCPGPEEGLQFYASLRLGGMPRRASPARARRSGPSRSLNRLLRRSRSPGCSQGAVLARFRTARLGSGHGLRGSRWRPRRQRVAVAEMSPTRPCRCHRRRRLIRQRLGIPVSGEVWPVGLSSPLDVWTGAAGPGSPASCEWTTIGGCAPLWAKEEAMIERTTSCNRSRGGPLPRSTLHNRCRRESPRPDRETT
jgi:hypothetical protein